MKLVDLRGHTSPTSGQNGSSTRPRLRRGPVSPNNVLLRKKLNGVRAREGLRAPC